MDKNCIGCSIVNGELELIGGNIYETEHFILGQDSDVPLKGFLIIQTKEHVNSMLDFSEKEQIELIKLIHKTRVALEELNICKEVTIVQEERSKHFHIWLFPNYEWMQEKFGKGIKYLRDINEYVIQNATDEDKEEVLKINEELKKYFNNKGEKYGSKRIKSSAN